MSTLFGKLCCLVRRCIFSVLSFGPMPNHVAFIMDGNRRYEKTRRMEQGSGHKAGYYTLLYILRCCFEMGVNYVTIYAFSIDNFKRKSEEVQTTMDLIIEKIDELLTNESIVMEYEVRINILGNLNLLNDAVRSSVEKAMRNTFHNKGPVLSVCLGYTSTNELAHAIEKCCYEKRDMMIKMNVSGCKNDFSEECDKHSVISVADIKRNLYTFGCPDPDIVIRTSGETRLSNFLRFQTNFSHLQILTPFWPDFALIDLVWAILKYQRGQPYFQEKNGRNKKID